MALGADAVSTGRAILPGLLKDVAAAVEEKLQQMNCQLKELMGYTAKSSPNQPSVLYNLIITLQRFFSPGSRNLSIPVRRMTSRPSG